MTQDTTPNMRAIADQVAQERGLNTPALPFYTPHQISQMTASEPDWIVKGYAAREAITELDGKVKRSGKTTLTLDLVHAVTTGRPWLGMPTTKTKVIYVTEQQRGPFRQAIDRAKLHFSNDLFVLFRRDFGGTPWPAVVAAVAEYALTVDAGLVVFDTISKLAGIREENSASDWTQAMEPLQNIAHDGLCVWVCRHSKKGFAEVGESGRGNSAASGDVDIIFDLRRPEGNQIGTRRVLESLSRYDDTPEKIVIELTDEEGFVLLGTDEAVSLADALRFVQSALTDGGENGLTLDELVARGQDNEPAVARTSIQRAIRQGQRDLSVTVTGKGKRGDPFRYRLAQVTATDSKPDSRPHRPNAEELREALTVVAN